MTIAEKLAQMRDELKQCVLQLLAADEDDMAAQFCAAMSTINQIRDQLAERGLDDDPWLSEGKTPNEGK